MDKEKEYWIKALFYDHMIKYPADNPQKVWDEDMAHIRSLYPKEIEYPGSYIADCIADAPLAMDEVNAETIRTIYRARLIELDKLWR